MSIILMVWLCSILEGITETLESLYDKLEDYTARRSFKRKLHNRRIHELG